MQRFSFGDGFDPLEKFTLQRGNHPVLFHGSNVFRQRIHEQVAQEPALGSGGRARITGVMLRIVAVPVSAGKSRRQCFQPAQRFGRLFWNAIHFDKVRMVRK